MRRSGEVVSQGGVARDRRQLDLFVALSLSRSRPVTLHYAAAGDDLPSSPRDPESAASGVEAQARVQEALLRLPPDLRMATVLYDIEGLSYKEIAATLNIPEGTVKSRIHRARSALRERLKGLVHADTEGDTQ